MALNPCSRGVVDLILPDGVLLDPDLLSRPRKRGPDILQFPGGFPHRSHGAHEVPTGSENPNLVRLGLNHPDPVHRVDRDASGVPEYRRSLAVAFPNTQVLGDLPPLFRVEIPDANRSRVLGYGYRGAGGQRECEAGVREYTSDPTDGTLATNRKSLHHASPPFRRNVHPPYNRLL